MLAVALFGVLAGLWRHYAPRQLRVVARFSYPLPEYERRHGRFFFEDLDPVPTGMLIDTYFSYSGTWAPFDEMQTFWDWNGKKRWQIAVSPSSSFQVVATSPDGRSVAILLDGRFEIWHEGKKIGNVAPGVDVGWRPAFAIDNAGRIWCLLLDIKIAVMDRHGMIATSRRLAGHDCSINLFSPRSR